MAASGPPAGGQATSRLDRLLTLMDTGSTPIIRRTAARQIGDIAKLHPTDLRSLLRRVQPLLRSRVWETRVAAAQAIGAMAEGVGHPTVEQLTRAANAALLLATPDMIQTETIRPVEFSVAPQEAGQTHSLTFQSFDVVRVLENGTLLMASGGQEYDVVEDVAKGSLDRVARQRRNLQRRLGLDGFEQFMDTQEIICDEDLMSPGSSPSVRNKKGTGQTLDSQTTNQGTQELMTQLVPSSLNRNLSARERNLLKRKARTLSKGPSWRNREVTEDEKPAKRAKALTETNLEAMPSDQVEGGDAMEEVMESTDSDINEGRWPFDTLCEELLLDIFDPVWEIRHGSMMALREILSSHAASAGASLQPPSRGSLDNLPAENLEGGGVPDLERSAGDRNVENNKVLEAVETARLAQAANLQFQQDCAVRLLCIFSLDRFGDYVSDQVVAPIRETCAQALGALARVMPLSFLRHTLSVLLQMQDRPEWEVRHGCLLGVKYIVAVRQELIEELLPQVLPACMGGLSDPDDDVRAVAAEALMPAATSICKRSGQRLTVLMSQLWDILLDLDDLSPSTSSVMNLLAELYGQRKATQLACEKSPSSVSRPVLDLDLNFPLGAVEDPEISDESLPPLRDLAPRLWPLMRHNISAVRHAAVQTLERLLEAGAENTEDRGKDGGSWVGPIVEEALRLVLQNMLLERSETVLGCSQRVWALLLKAAGSQLIKSSGLHLPSWLKLAATPTGAALDASLLLQPGAAGSTASRSLGKRSLNRKEQSKATSRLGSLPGASQGTAIVSADGEGFAVSTRVAVTEALGQLAACLPTENLQVICRPITDLLASQSSVNRQVGCMVISSWFRAQQSYGSLELIQSKPEVLPLRAQLMELLGSQDPAQPSLGSTAPYLETTRAYAKLRSEVGALLQQAINAKAPYTLKESVDSMCVDSAVELAMSFRNVGGCKVPEAAGSPAEHLEGCRQRLLTTAGYLQTIQSNMHVAVLAAAAGAVVWMRQLPTKLNPIIQPLMAAIKREKEFAFQQAAATALAELVQQCTGRKPGPNDKLLRNLCTLTCADPSETPRATAKNLEDEDEMLVEPGNGKVDGGPLETTQEPLADRERMEAGITRRGAELALKALSQAFGKGLFIHLPRLWECMSDVLPAVDETVPLGIRPSWLDRPLPVVQAELQAVVNNLQVIRSMASLLDVGLHGEILRLLPAVMSCIRHELSAVRKMTGKCIAEMAKAAPQAVMGAVLAVILPMLADTTSEAARRGAATVVAELVNVAGAKLVGYASLLVVPLLGRMSDPSPQVRQVVTQSFATLVPLLPLARGMGPPPLLDAAQAAKAEEDAHFLEQLLDNKRVEDYQLHVPLKVTLRRYQQEGINWLAFLVRFRLHGILCDDMGLGKTLQASAIMASESAQRASAYALTKSPDAAPLPCLVICPPTLVGHWAYEVEKFIPTSVLSPLQYEGSAGERFQLRSQLPNHNLVITSYEVLRADIEWLEKVVWNFCILDEGHMIKSAKSRTAQAAKRIRAEHRLVLSGTPLQNNVLELWSLFDFLMPGFLGSERQFHLAYGKPLLASRDPKCTAKQAEAGVLALEALHRQVMPFMLRRTKDQVLKDLPPKIIQDRYCDVSPLQQMLYEDFSRSQTKNQLTGLVSAYDIKDEETTPMPSKDTSTHVFQALQYLRKLCSHPLLVIDEMQPQHVAALDAQATATGKPLDLHDLHHSPKLLALQGILHECGIGLPGSAESLADSSGSSHRVLIFAQLKGFLDIIERDLFQRHMPNVSHLRLDGSVEASKRFEIVRRFNADPTIDVLLLTTHVGGLGLNLTAADTVVFMEHDWNPMRDLQAMDRAHRLGQQRVVNVHRLIMRSTLEEKMMSLQRFKLSVANSVVNADNASLNTMDTTQLLDLFNIPKSTRSSNMGRDSQADIAADAVVTKGKGLKAMLNSLEELWDEAQYAEEYNLNTFVSRLKS